MRTILLGVLCVCCCACARTSDNKSPGSTSSSTNTSGSAHQLGNSVHAASPTLSTDADAKLTQTVRRALSDDSTLSSAAKDATVAARDGVVTLTGAVPSQAEKERVEKDATNVAGVQRIDNQLTVKP
jgi:hyperosmotically inducible protein